MAISRKPRPASTPELDVEALINKGGSAPSEKNGKAQKETVPVILRLPSEMLEQIDASVKAQRVPTPRHRWLLEAVCEKLAREQQPHA